MGSRAPLKIVIVGGGITGLSAAFHLQREAARRGLSVEYVLIEADAALGGKIHSERMGTDGAFLVEVGPDSLLTSKPWGLQLVHDLGLEHELVEINEAPAAVSVLWKGKLRPLPEGMQLGIPTRPLSIATSGLFSLAGKLRMAADLALPPRRGSEDESVGAFIRRRLGREALDRVAEPLLAGIYSADAEQQSLLATFPQLRALEQEYGSLIRGMMSVARSTARQRQRRRAPFVTLKSGMDRLVTRLQDALDGPVIMGNVVQSVVRQPAPAGHPYLVALRDGRTIDADSVILAVPAFAAAQIVSGLHPELAGQLRRIRYVSSGLVNLAYPRSGFPPLLRGYGIIVPHREGRRINACTISSAKFAHRAPADHALVRVFIGGSRWPEFVDLEDEALVELARRELEGVLGLKAKAEFAHVTRWIYGSPQYDVGHLERVAGLDELCPPGILLRGSAYRGVGIPDCIRQGQEAAERVLVGRAARHP